MKKYLLITVLAAFLLWAVSTNAETVSPPPSVAHGNVTLGDTFTMNGNVYSTYED